MTDFLIAAPCIVLFSIALVYIDPLSLIADWWDERREQSRRQ